MCHGEWCHAWHGMIPHLFPLLGNTFCWVQQTFSYPGPRLTQCQRQKPMKPACAKYGSSTFTCYSLPGPCPGFKVWGDTVLKKSLTRQGARFETSRQSPSSAIHNWRPTLSTLHICGREWGQGRVRWDRGHSLMFTRHQLFCSNQCWRLVSKVV